MMMMMMMMLTLARRRQSNITDVRDKLYHTAAGVLVMLY